MNKPAAVPETNEGDDLRTILIALAGKESDLSAKARAAIVAHLKTVLAEGRASAEVQLRADGKGRACARRLSALQDAIIVALYDLAEHVYKSGKPSAAERMAVVAVGG